MQADLDKKIYYGYWLIGAAFVAQFVSVGMYSYVLGSFMNPMVEELGWSRADFTLTRTIGQLVMAVVGIFVGARIDRYGGRAIMLIGTTVLSITLALHSFVESLWVWWLLNGVVLTLGCALLGNLVVNVTLSKWFVINRGKAIAFAAMGVSFGGVALTPLATWMIDTIGWREAWVWLGVITAVLMYPVALFMRRAPEDHGLNPDGLSDAQVAAGGDAAAAAENANAYTRRQALRTLTFYALVIAFGFFTINIVVILLHTVPYLTDSGFTRNEAALAMLIASVPAMLSKPIWGYLIDRSPTKPLAAISATVTGLALFMIVAAVAGQQLFWIYAAYVLLGLGWGGMIPMQEVLWATFFGRRYIGAIRGAGMPFTLALGAAAPWLVSYYHDLVGEYDGALLVVATLNVISGVLILLVPAPRKK
jgi:OFA family oxalate/formate antiporter-like MFS transporter